MKVVIAAAGTGGHINPGIAIANKIKQENKNAKITFIGTLRGLENDLVPRAGFDLERIEAYGISRKFSVQNFKNMCKTITSFKKAKKLIKKLNPDIVIGTGGYICGPVILAAHKYKIPCIIHESNAYPGVTVKLLSGKVDEVLVGFEDAKARLIMNNNDTPYERLTQTVDKSNSFCDNEFLKKGVCIYLTKDKEITGDKQVSWEDDSDEES